MYSITPEQLQEYIARTEADGGDMDLDAHYWAGFCYAAELGGVRRANYEQAVMIWSRALTQNGSSKVGEEGIRDNTGKIRYRLGTCYEHGRGVQQLKSRADELYCQAMPRLQYEAATEPGDMESRFILGRIYYQRLTGVVETDLVQAAYWFERAANQGQRGAMIYIAKCYRHGKGVDLDLVRAVEWYKKASLDRIREHFLNSLEINERNRVTGCVQRNQWIQNIQDSVLLNPSLGVWSLALKKVGTSHDNRWASLSPTFMCLLHMMPLLIDATTEMQFFSRKRNLDQHSNPN